MPEPNWAIRFSLGNQLRQFILKGHKNARVDAALLGGPCEGLNTGRWMTENLDFHQRKAKQIYSTNDRLSAQEQERWSSSCLTFFQFLRVSQRPEGIRDKKYSCVVAPSPPLHLPHLFWWQSEILMEYHSSRVQKWSRQPLRIWSQTRLCTTENVNFL